MKERGEQKPGLEEEIVHIFLFNVKIDCAWSGVVICKRVDWAQRGLDDCGEKTDRRRRARRADRFCSRLGIELRIMCYRRCRRSRSPFIL